MSNYNLNEQVGEDFFAIDLDGEIYRFYYPTSEDILSLEEQDSSTEQLAQKLVKLEKEIEESTGVKQAKLLDEKLELINQIKQSKQTFTDWCMSYIKPEKPEAPDFKSTLFKKNVKYLLAFTEIVKKELND